MLLILLSAILISLVYGREQSYTYLSAKVMEEKIGIDWWDILNADITCCPINTDKDSCEAEAGSNCRFLKPNNPIAIAAGAQCVGQSFIKCKQEGGITACCTPKCNPPPPGQNPPDQGAPGGVTPPVCGPVTPAPVTPAPVTPAPVTPAPVTPAPVTPAPVTPAPVTPAPVTPSPLATPAPTKEKCAIGVNYAFEGIPCQISGDPHTKKTQGGKHDFQGQPTETNLNGELLNQFYYVAPCDGFDSSDMPISVLATHYHWGTRPVSGIDYFTIILTRDDGTDLYVYASSELHGYSIDAAATTNYDETLANPAATITGLNSNVATDIGGGKFTITYKYISYKQATFTIKIDNDENKKIYINMVGQMNRETALGNTRYRMHYVYMTQSSEYKCMACGLCGDYSGAASTSELVLCDGSVETVRTGWDGTKTTEAYDLFGLTYEYNFYNDRCGDDYDIRNNFKSLQYVDPCDPLIAQAVATACEAEKTANENCCNTVIGGTVCQDIVDDCKFDACVIATDLIIDGTAQSDAISQAVASLFDDTINAACNIDGIGDAVDPGNTLPGSYIGCYIDDGNRRFEWPTRVAGAGGVRSLTGDSHSIATCIKICTTEAAGAPYQYMGLQYGKECFCGNDLAYIQGLGERDASTGSCGMNEKGTDAYNAYGCWGGGWTNCVYKLGGGNTRHHNNIFMVENNKLLSGSQESISDNMEFGIIGGIILIGAAGLIYKRYYDKNIKDSKYIPIKDDNKV